MTAPPTPTPTPATTTTPLRAPSKPRGLTLIEVLASLVLLSAIAAACLPLIQRALRTLQHQEPPVNGPNIELARIAVMILEEPNRSGLEEMLGDEAAVHVLSLPKVAQQVQVMALAQTQSADDHHEPGSRVRGRWIEIKLGEASVLRWVEVPRTDADAMEGGGAGGGG